MKNNFILIKSKGKRDFLKYKKAVHVFAKERIEHFNGFYGFKYNKICIRNQKSRWGSCSKKGNLNFNYKIALIPSEISDYIIVHELCHLKEFNHSKSFWDLVGQAVPDYAFKRKELKRIRFVKNA